LNYYLTLGFVLTVAAAALLSPPAARPAVFAIVAVGACLGGLRLGESLIVAFGGLSALLTAADSGAMGLAGAVWVAAPGSWPSAGGAVWMALATLALCALAPNPSPRPTGAGSSVLAVVLGSTAAALVAIGGALIVRNAALLSAMVTDAARVATLKTAVLSLAIVLLAAGRRSPRLHAVSWLTYPALALGAVKLLLEDLPQGSPALLVVSLVSYGAALTVASRLMRGPLAAGPTSGTPAAVASADHRNDRPRVP
jgi:hypothetical protein